ncbi:MAG: hypothetical protein U9N82_02255 [Thermodesulfobacteriota bacterium]|nr:hypothetical protein [Thermodesulfobacteriota bacterium]
MRTRTICVILFGMLVITGCAVQKYRTEKIELQHPDWDQATVQKVAKRQISPGMTSEMVVAGLGKPDSILREGDQERWGYAAFVGDFEPRKTFVYFVYLKYGLVTKTTGDRSRMSYVSWYE